jgi:hypothetical protein
MDNIKTKESKITKKLKKLDNQISDEDQIFPDRSGVLYLVVGRKGSGKSTVVLNLLNTKRKDGGYRGHFDNIYMVNPNGKDEKYSKLVKELSRTGNYYTEMTNEVLKDIEDKVRSFNENFDEDRKPANLLILDDCIHFLPKSNQKAQIFHGIITGARHLKLSIIITLQKLKGANTIVRSNTDIASFWRTDVASEKKDIMEEFGIPENYLDACWSEKNGFCTVAFTSGKPKYYNKFDEIIN